jgi:hypothetical protein
VVLRGDRHLRIAARQRLVTRRNLSLRQEHDASTFNQQPATSNQQPTTNNQQPTTNNQQPTTNNRRD